MYTNIFIDSKTKKKFTERNLKTTKVKRKMKAEQKRDEMGGKISKLRELIIYYRKFKAPKYVKP